MNDAVVEIWQANAQGRYAHPDDAQDKPLEPTFKGFGRVTTDNDGMFRLTTIKPGRVAAPGGGSQAPHLNVTIFTRGLLKHLITRMYFPGDPLFPFDPIFNSVTDEKARNRMISSFDLENTKPDWALCYRFNIVLRGRNATPMENK